MMKKFGKFSVVDCGSTIGCWQLWACFENFLAISSLVVIAWCGIELARVENHCVRRLKYEFQTVFAFLFVHRKLLLKNHCIIGKYNENREN